MMDKEQLEQLYKAICDTLRPVAERKAEEVVAGCGKLGCGGVGTIMTATDGDGGPAIPELIPCPTCAPKRDLMLAWAEKLAWHKTRVTSCLPTGDSLGEWEGYWKCTCGAEGSEISDSMAGTYVRHHTAEDNPRFSIEPIEGHLSLVQFLKDAGEWKGFALWLAMEQVCLIGTISDWQDDKRRATEYAEILQTLEYFAQAIKSYFTRGEG
jgi:hypothetical protein